VSEGEKWCPKHPASSGAASTGGRGTTTRKEKRKALKKLKRKLLKYKLNFSIKVK
jgi:hypothetical protein